jgi:uncharacterized SAM-binding protein YcdF (DUF218 family)
MYRFVVDFLQPHTILVLWVCVALFVMWWRRGATKRRIWPVVVPLLALAVMSTPAVSYLAFLSLESYAPPLEVRPADAQAIVVFSAGMSPPEAPRLRPALDNESLNRCLEAARLYRQDPHCKVFVSGGKVEADSPGPSLAAALGEFLVQLGVEKPDLILEEQSPTTYENAVATGQLLNERQIHRVVLVVDAVDMARAAGCLRKQGIEVIPAPCHFRASRFKWSVVTFLPSPSGAAGFQRVWHEWLGMAWYWCHGRL